jgi:hypothetical protein
MRLTRLGNGPIIGPDTPARGDGSSIGDNIQGPSLIRTPGWIDDPLGTYSLYFADHKGGYIRLAHADAVTGPWTVHAPGSLQLADSTLITTPPEASPEQLRGSKRCTPSTSDRLVRRWCSSTRRHRTSPRPTSM